ncbi:MAG TPA: YihY/virulence factor BrkB family protein [Burkholderiaceae bacterium]|nr:YihY/virulence factor BrkB family protein [Burkholderiaceae bacterium]
MPALRVLADAVRGYVFHQCGNYAGSVAFSTMIAMFPLLILLAATAGFVGQPGAAAELAARVLEYAPPIVREAMQPVIDQVLSHRNRTLLTIGFVVTVWAASSGMQSIRTALNRAYGVERGQPFWKARLKVAAFTIVVGGGTVVAFGSVVLMPYIWRILGDMSAEGSWIRESVRYVAAFIVLILLYTITYAWLPDVKQRLRSVLAGAIVGAGLWVLAAALLSHVWRTAGKLELVYGGFAGLIATLAFLYVSAATLIFGAEINAALRAAPDRSGAAGVGAAVADA